MLLRALIVLLVVVNLGVAAWWALRAPPPAPAAVTLPAGMPRLQLLSEAPRTSTPSKPVVAAAHANAAPVAATEAAPTQCFRFGPYASPAALRRAHARLQAQGLRTRVREVARGTPSGWRVYMPPLASRAEAQALVERMRAAGIDDLLVLGEGSDANGIALGRYSSEASARRRQQALAAGGWTAQVAAMGDVAVQGWIDVGARAGFDATRVAQDIAAASQAPVDCASLVDDTAQPPANAPADATG